MVNPISTAHNQYHTNKKNSTIYTPVGVSKFLFDTLHLDFPCANVFDPAIGTGRLTDPWFESGHEIHGCDTVEQSAKCHHLTVGKFEEQNEFDTPDLVLMNPPFNGAPKGRMYTEVFLRHVFDLFGVRIPTVMFCPMGFLLNQRLCSKRWRWMRDCGARITSSVSLPLNIFPNVEFHVEILIFNIYGLEAHYYLPEEYL